MAIRQGFSALLRYENISSNVAEGLAIAPKPIPQVGCPLMSNVISERSEVNTFKRYPIQIYLSDVIYPIQLCQRRSQNRVRACCIDIYDKGMILLFNLRAARNNGVLNRFCPINAAKSVLYCFHSSRARQYLPSLFLYHRSIPMIHSRLLQMDFS